MPASDQFRFANEVRAISRSARQEVRGPDGSSAIVEINVTGPEELVIKYLEANPITIEVYKGDAYYQLRDEILAEAPQDKEPLAPPDLTRLPPQPDVAANSISIRLAVIEASEPRLAFKLVIDPELPAGCSHHYYFTAVAVVARVIDVNNNPDLELNFHNSVYYQYYTSGDWSVQYPVGGGAPSGDTHYWWMRVYGRGGNPCSYNLNAAFGSPTAVADNPNWAPIG